MNPRCRLSSYFHHQQGTLKEKRAWGSISGQRWFPGHGWKSRKEEKKSVWFWRRKPNEPLVMSVSSASSVHRLQYTNAVPIHVVLGLEGFQKGDVLIKSISQGLDFVNAANRRIAPDKSRCSHRRVMVCIM